MSQLEAELLRSKPRPARPLSVFVSSPARRIVLFPVNRALARRRKTEKENHSDGDLL
jgi:hypothetical protein